MKYRRNIVALVLASISTMALATDNSSTEITRALTVSQGINDRDVAMATKYLDPDRYKDHNLMSTGDVDGVAQFISQLPPGKTSLQVVRAFQDGPYVFTQSEGNIFGGKVIFDIYRFQDGLIVEHWDNIARMTPPNQSGHTPVDGPTRAVDLEETQKNKALITDFYQTIFLKGDFSQMPKYFDGDKFIRHDARGGDGLSALGALMQAQAKQGIVMTVTKIEKVLGQGDFVLVAASGSIAEKPMAYYDLFRVANGKIAEHWDAIEDILPSNQAMNQNGKF